MINENILILGNPGSGKSYLAEEMSKILSMPLIELDEIFWGPNWTKLDISNVHDLVKQKIEFCPHIIEGQYPEMKDLLPSYSNTIIYIDLPLRVLFWRLLKRSIRRALYREELCGGNRETFRKLLFSKHSMIYYIFQIFDENRRDNDEIIYRAQQQKKATYVLKCRTEVTKFLNDLNLEKRKI